MSTQHAVGSPTHATWHPGDKFTNTPAVDRCACWTAPDQKEHAACYKLNERVAVAFDKPCEGVEDLETSMPKLVGTPITWLVWQPAVWEEGTL